MARLVFDGNYEVYYVATPITGAPSVAALTSGTNLTSFVPKDGFNPAVTNNRVSGGALDDLFMDESMGTYSSQLAITFYKDDTTDTAWEVLGVQGTTGAIVVVPNGPAASGTKCYVWGDVETGQPVLPTTAENTRQKFTVEFAVRVKPDFHATLAA